MTRKLTLTTMMAAVALLGACGGGSDDAYTPPPAPAPAPDPLAAVPDAARQSTDGLLSYLKTLSTNTSDTRDPLPLDGLTLPTSDNTEPGSI